MIFTIGLLCAVGSASALNRADYPAPLKVPAANPEWTSAIEARMGNAAPVIDRCNAQNQWAFSFDDGPASSTALVLDALAARQQKATFFVIGSQILDNEGMLQRISKEGHQIGIHTWSHTSLPSLSVGQIVSELAWSAKLIKEVTGLTPTIVRPPYGDEDEKVRRVASAMGLSIVKWNRDPNDWMFNFWKPGNQLGVPFQPNDTPEAITRQFSEWVSQPRRGTISLQHDVGIEPSKQAGPAMDINNR
jgi:peptidoglycan/xylan/chitin deacetylase (PgdA/CDA1 family)